MKPKRIESAFLDPWQTIPLRSNRLKDVANTLPQKSWIPKLETHFREHGLSNVNATTFPPIHEQRKAYTDNFLMGLEDSCDLFSARDKASELGTKPQWRELFHKAVMETKKGVSFTADMIVVVGRKPV